MTPRPLPPHRIRTSRGIGIEETRGGARRALPAHRFQRRKKADPIDGVPDNPTFVFDFDETITKSPDRMAYIAAAVKAAGARVVVVTGNQSPRDELVSRLEAYDFPFDDLIQYEDDESDGLRRAAILKQLDAWCAFDDRAGRAVTYTKICPHLFLSAKPSKPAKKKGDGAKKAAKKAVKKQQRAGAPEPPNYRAVPEGSAERCGTCVMNDNGVCWRYGNKPIDEAGHVCDSWERETDNEES